MSSPKLEPHCKGLKKSHTLQGKIKVSLVDISDFTWSRSLPSYDPENHRASVATSSGKYKTKTVKTEYSLEHNSEHGKGPENIQLSLGFVLFFFQSWLLPIPCAKTVSGTYQWMMMIITIRLTQVAARNFKTKVLYYIHLFWS